MLYGIEDFYIKVWLENLRERRELKDFGYHFEANIVLNFKRNIHEVMKYIELAYDLCPVARLCKQSYEFSDSIRQWNFLVSRITLNLP